MNRKRFNIHQLYDPQEMQEVYPDLILVRTAKIGNESVELYYDVETWRFFEKAKYRAQTSLKMKWFDLDDPSTWGSEYQDIVEVAPIPKIDPRLLPFPAFQCGDIEKVQHAFPNLVLLKQAGRGAWAIKLYFDPDTRAFFEQGPFARWDMVCIRRVPRITEEAWDKLAKEVSGNEAIVSVNPFPNEK